MHDMSRCEHGIVLAKNERCGGQFKWGHIIKRYEADIQRQVQCLLFLLEQIPLRGTSYEQNLRAEPMTQAHLTLPSAPSAPEDTPRTPQKRRSHGRFLGHQRASKKNST